MSSKPIRTALISVFSKDGLEPIIRLLNKQGVKIYSTGGTQEYIEQLGVAVIPVEGLTGYPSILEGRVKTLHPKIFGGILARGREDHLAQLSQYDIPEIDLVIVDLYPFAQTVASTDDSDAIIEKIDIGGISLIRAAAKNFQDVVIIPSVNDYDEFLQILSSKEGSTEIEDRRRWAAKAFAVSSHYDSAIFQWFNRDEAIPVFAEHHLQSKTLRYGENPHQKALFYGDLEQQFEFLNGKELSYNNLVDVDAGVQLMSEFEHATPTFAILKHTNPCGIATRPTLPEAWDVALACDPVSAFGGILISNREIDIETALKIDTIFYEVLIAPAFSADALDLLRKKKNRILLRIHSFATQPVLFKTLLNGVISQDADQRTENMDDLRTVTKASPTAEQAEDLLFAIKCVKHLKSNTIVLVRDQQMIGMGSGQTSRIDAMRQSIAKAHAFGFETAGAVMASDAFFPFADSVAIAREAGILAISQPGGSIKDNESIEFCDLHGMAMVMTGIRHFKH
ncbi:MAG: bifunctional phosphoribosylaminoimidazolecarboxamide formyltransferase/IMP cyclohydrolase [Saprospiraceae bacterium]